MSKFNSNAMASAINEYKEVYGDGRVKSPVAGRVYGDVNHEGARSFDVSSPMELYSLVCTMAIQDKFYESTSDQMIRLVSLIKGNDPMFVARLAVYARTKMYLRSVPLTLVVELAKIHRGDDLISRMIERVLLRADEICGLLKAYQTANHRTGDKKLAKLSNQIKKGIRTAFEDGRFDEYQFAKYNGGGDVKLRDAIFLTHPKPQNPEQKVLFDKIINNSLEIPYTWETQMSAGDKPKNEIWEDMIMSGKMGYMAMLRNLRNFITTGVKAECMTKVGEIISNPTNVRKSKQLPFRFLSAYRSLVNPELRWGNNGVVPEEVANSPYIPVLTLALEQAISVSAESIPMFDDGRVLIATDVSGSMMTPISGNSVIECYDIGALMAMMASKGQDNSVCGFFGNHFKTIDSDPEHILRNTMEIRRREGEVGYATMGGTVIDYALRATEPFKHIMIFTDCQMYGSRGHGGDIDRVWREYRSRNPEASLYLFNLNGYGGSPVEVRDNNVFTISGWSDKVFDILDRIRNSQTALDEINSVMV